MPPIDPNKLPDTLNIIKQVAAIRVRMCDQDIINLDKKTQRIKLEQEFYSFFELYPSLFRQVYETGPDGDLTFLAQMLQMIDKIKSKQISVEKAEKKLGEDLADKYLYPKVGK